MAEFLLLLTLAIATWFWLDTISKRETAIAHGRQLAQRYGLQLLDETVACHKIGLARDTRGRAQLLRLYEFEVSANGDTRLACTLQLRGKELLNWHIPPYVQPLY